MRFNSTSVGSTVVCLVQRFLWGMECLCGMHSHQMAEARRSCVTCTREPPPDVAPHESVRPMGSTSSSQQRRPRHASSSPPTSLATRHFLDALGAQAKTGGPLRCFVRTNMNRSRQLKPAKLGCPTPHTRGRGAARTLHRILPTSTVSAERNSAACPSGCQKEYPMSSDSVMRR